MSLENLPAELLVQIVVRLRHHDLGRLAQVSSTFQALAEPLLWGSIELHTPHYHRAQRPLPQHVQKEFQFMDLDELAHPKVEKHVHDGVMEEVTITFLTICRTLRREQPERWHKLASRVRSLCLTVDGDNLEDEEDTLDPWNTILGFPNLEFLDILGNEIGSDKLLQIQADTEPLTKLSYLRLRGYIPKDFVRAVYRKAPNVERLDLGLLDKPIGTLDDSDDDEEVEEEEDDEDPMAPRPLLGVFDSGMQHSGSLTHLHLCKPAETPDYYLSHWELTFDTSRDKNLLQEWATMLRGARGTIVELILEHRRAILADDDKMVNNAMPPLEQGVDADLRFCELLLLPVFFGGGDWPSLKRLEFRGIQLSPQDAPDRETELRKMFPTVEIQVNQGFYMYYNEDHEPNISNGRNEDGLLPNRGCDE